MSPTTPPPADRAADTDADEARKTESQMWTFVGHMAAALTVYGGLGYLLGRWTGHPILLLVGVLLGMVLSLGYTVYIATKSSTE
jgi:F0F1-type ATP synthase assembly protein I